ncbi:hypothetical protein KDRO_E00400 [Kluyveromyces lactis]|nr:hypothetical protein KDRO_E00400 [Kluyveromyces lactis]
MLRRMSELVSSLSGLNIASAGSKSVVTPSDNADLTKGGRRNQALTKPITIDSNTGEVLVKKTTGKTKVRRGQSVEEYKEQLRQYFLEEKGPTRTEEDALKMEDFDLLIEDESFDYALKQVRQKMVSYAQKYYYERDYMKCLKVSEPLLHKFEPFNKKNKIRRELEELRYMIEKSKARLEL